MKRFVIVADDLIWMSRLAAAAERVGGSVVRVAGAAQLAGALSDPADAVIIDLNGRNYDGLALIAPSAAAGPIVVAVGQHEDVELRRQALAAGARQVYSYNRFFREGPALLSRLLPSPAEAGR